MQYIYVFIGGGLGSICRFLLSRSEFPYVSQYPVGTFISNILSCFILGIVIQHLSPSNGNDPAKLFLAVGFCGGFSTFSTFTFEIFHDINNGAFLIAAAYIILSVVLGLLAMYAGMQMIRIF